MRNIFLLSALLFLLSACRPTPFQVRTLPITKPLSVAAPDSKSYELDQNTKDSLMSRYKQVKSPSIAIIRGSYALPRAQPFGAATVVRGYSYQTYIEAIELKTPRAFRVEPLAGDDALSLSQATNSLLDMGVRLHEIDMTDALALAKAEEDAMAHNDRPLFWSKHLPPTVDLLLTVYKADSERGPLWIGRVINKDGRLLAFRVMYHAQGSELLSALILSLFEDTVNRL